MDDLLNLLMHFDPVKWIDDLITTMRLGRGVKLEWPRSAATGGQVEMILRKYGIKVYARQYSENKKGPYGVTVRAEQAIWAQYLLDAYLSSGQMPQETWKAPAKPQGFGGVVADWLSGGLQ